MSHFHTDEKAGSMIVGFILAAGNQLFGWFHTLLSIDGSQINEYGQALITGGIGAVGAYFTNRLLKFVEKKVKKSKNETKQTT